MRDTSTDADAAVRGAIRRVPPVERMRRMLEFSETMREIALSALRARHPGRTTIELVEMMVGERLRPLDSGSPEP